jgi:hypothetical protein
MQVGESDEEALSKTVHNLSSNAAENGNQEMEKESLSRVRIGDKPSLAEVKVKLKEIFEFYA